MMRPARDTLILGFFSLSLWVPVGAHSAAIDMHDNTFSAGAAQSTVPELYPGETDDVGPQVAVTAKPVHLHLEAMLDSQYYHTSNLFLTENDPPFGPEVKSSEVLLTSIELAGTSDPAVIGDGEFQPRLGYRQQWYDFNRSDPNAFPPYDANDLDFYAQTLFMEARYRYQRLWIFEGGFDWTRLSYTSGDSNFYSEVVPHWGVRRLIPLDDERVITAGYQGAYHATNTDVPPYGIDFPSNVNDRFSHSVFVTYTQSITPKLIVQPYYRFKFTDYSHYVANSTPTDRSDYLHTVGATVNYYILPQISVRGFVSYDINDSTADDSAVGPVYDYKKLDAGVGINLNYRF